ncbi:MAG: protein-(glutamine-N5) methyltransferase, release factor-specific [Gammaproteobacteria bacterium]|nr:protein-(glutamine-N5) methyltransferase, release factor-specific [Gammaproteobacteria bacterium]
MDDYSALKQIKLLTQSSTLSSQLDIELLVLHLLNIDKNVLYRDNPSLTKETCNELKDLIKRREKGEPLAYLINQIGFWNLSLYVDNKVLVPRPETETIIQNILETFSSNQIKVLDLGTGSGAIGLSLAKERKNWEVICSDMSLEAIKVTEKNMLMNSLNVSLVNSNWLAAFKNECFDLIVSNPPYINPSDPRVLSDGLKFEPIEALVSDCEGFKDIEQIVKESCKSLNNSGYLFLEHGYDQADQVVSIFENYDFSQIRTFKDLNGDDRVCSGKLNKC